MERLCHPGTTVHDVERPIYSPGGGTRLCQMGTLRWDRLWVLLRGEAGWRVWDGAQVCVCSLVMVGVDSAVDVVRWHLQSPALWAAFMLKPLGMGHLKLIWKHQHSQRGEGFHSSQEH